MIPPVSKTLKESDNPSITIKGRLVARQPIRRRTTKREARQLRNGICSDGEGCSSDEDGYITMNPQLLKSAPLDKRASGYYLKILPPQDTSSRERRALSEEPLFYDSDSYLKLLPASAGTQSGPDSPDYVPMDSWKTDTSSIDGESERDNPTNWIAGLVAPGNATPTQKEQGKTPPSLPPKQKPIHYSDVTIQPVPTLPWKPSKPQKFKYETVDLKETMATKPHPPTTKVIADDHIYYKTTSKNGEMPSLTHSLPSRRFEIHSYVEIDTDDIEQMKLQSDRPMKLQSDRPMNLQRDRPMKLQSDRPMKLQSDRPIELDSPIDPLSMSIESSPYKIGPPTIPNRPDDLDGWAESTVHSRQHIISGTHTHTHKHKHTVTHTHTHKFHSEDTALDEHNLSSEGRITIILCFSGSLK